MKQERWKSKVFWIGIVCVVMIIIGNYGLYDAIGMNESTFGKVASIILDLIFGGGATYGIANNPTDSKNF